MVLSRLEANMVLSRLEANVFISVRLMWLYLG